MMRAATILCGHLLIASVFGASLFRKCATYSQPAKVATQDLDIPSKLSTREWHYKSGSKEAFTIGLFYDGTFRRSIVSDYSEVRTGIWGYKELGPDSGLLFMLTQRKSRSVRYDSDEENVFMVRVSNNVLRLGRYLLQAGNPSEQTGELRRFAIREVVNEKNFSDYFQLTARAWSKLGSKDDSFMPDVVSLRRDGTFAASYRKRECRHSGYWDLEGHEIFLQLPADHCDTRGYREPVVQGHYYTFESGSLVLDGSYKYLPSQ